MLADPLPYRHRNTFRGESREVLKTPSKKQQAAGSILAR
jgi:hypothetical protein